MRKYLHVSVVRIGCILSMECVLWDSKDISIAHQSTAQIIIKFELYVKL